MSKFAAIRNSKKPALHTRVAVVAAGLGMTAALGAGVANAAGSNLTNVASGVAPALSKQADAQVKAAADAKKAAKAQQAKAAAKRAAAKKAGAWVAPLDKYTLGSTFGLAGNMWSAKHSGQDFVVPSGTPVKSASKGTVVKAGPNGGGDGPAYGNAIVIKHANGKYTQYAHLSAIHVQVGQKVGTDQKIGLVGSTGNSSGPHLHFEVRTGPNYGTGIEPTGFLRAHGASV
ncbi:M23 family metallopeptidase [Streptomyces halobius]|uniref:M23 family metallopeptidase n=1 Tax=Streptomyces halobius TaxID=2879846 RepID=A0ABY4M9U4_9ACTN|nr:M23 family metallopeptidase [Streptomyces halobius]UQA93913.1 M23 family metallopeptidase [Streptomyces halobius]